MTGHAAKTDRVALLGPDDPAPFELINPDGAGPGVLICDHASNAVPRRLKGLGLPDGVLDQHVAYDIGAAGVAEHLAVALDMPLIRSGYSRLVIDINRPTDDFTSIREISDGIVVPGNRGLDTEAMALRAESLFWPYHHRLEEMIAAKRQAVLHDGLQAPAIISVHSCTDSMRGMKRPWHIGVLYNRDTRMAQSTLAVLQRQNPDLVIGDNKPYSGMDAYGFSIERHALPHGYPNVLFEVRQDLIGTPDGQAEYAGVLARALEEVLADRSLFSHHRA